MIGLIKFYCMNQYKLLLVFSMNLLAFSLSSQTWRNDFHFLQKENYQKSKESIKSYHPNIFSYYDEDFFDRKVDSLSAYLPLDSIRETELIHWYRKAFDLLTYNDPHFRILPELRPVDGVKVKAKDIYVLPFSLLCINDTLIVDKSIDGKILRGDRIISIDNINASDFVDYSYRDRYTNSVLMQMQYHYHLKNEYNIVVERSGLDRDIMLKGIGLNKYNNHMILRGVDYQLMDDVGYIRFDRFTYNNYIIKCLNNLLDKADKAGVKDIIIDIRRNPGGTGEDFDKLLSIFFNNNTISYQKGVKVKYSEWTKDYEFSNDSVGKVIQLPDSLFYENIPLIQELYRGHRNYYVLVSSQTSSVASTFANILQFNNGGLIIGEALKKNALRFGEVEKASFKESGVAIISTVEYDEYTKAVDGILYPDIEIPYVASEYMRGGDPVLEKLIDIIKSTNEKN